MANLLLGGTSAGDSDDLAVHWLTRDHRRCWTSRMGLHILPWHLARGRVVRQRSLVSAGAEGLRRRLAGSMDRCKTHSGEAIAGKIYRWNEMAHASRRIS